MALSAVTSLQVAIIGVFLYSSLSINLLSCVCVMILIGTIFLQKRGSEPELLDPFKGKLKRNALDIDPDLLASTKSAVYNYVTYQAQENPSSLRRFDLIKNNTECIFAKKAKLWGSPEWKHGISLERNIERSLPTFLAFTSLCPVEPLDGFLYELPGDIYGHDLEMFSEAVCCTLKVLSDNDPRGRKCMDQKHINKRGWIFEFNNVTFFITTFAPFYPESHSRFAFGSEMCYILFQPEISFARHDLGPDTPVTNWKEPKTSRDRIRCSFRNAGRGYEIPKTIASPVANEIVKPLNCDPDKRDANIAVDWWKSRDTLRLTVKMVSLDE